MVVNNHHCCADGCGYRTYGYTEAESTAQLVAEGGFHENKKSLCPKCGYDSLVFIDESYKLECE